MQEVSYCLGTVCIYAPTRLSLTPRCILPQLGPRPRSPLLFCPSYPAAQTLTRKFVCHVYTFKNVFHWHDNSFSYKNKHTNMRCRKTRFRGQDLLKLLFQVVISLRQTILTIPLRKIPLSNKLGPNEHINFVI